MPEVLRNLVEESSKNFSARIEEEKYYLALNMGYYKTIEEMPLH